MPSVTKRFTNKTVLITGGSRGLGKAIANDFASEGANLILIARNKVQLNDVKKNLITKYNSEILTIDTDLGNTHNINSAFKLIKDQNIKLDYVINNAGYLKPQSIFELEIETWTNTFNVNVTAPLLISQKSISLFNQDPKSDKAIINISSLSGIPQIEKFPNMTSYIAAKHAVNGLTEGLSVELKDKGIRVNAIAPGAINTDMLRSLFPNYHSQTESSEISPIVIQLCDPKVSKYLTGTIIPIQCN